MGKYPEPSKEEIETTLIALAAETRSVGIELLDYLDIPRAHIFTHKLIAKYPTYFSRILVNYYNRHVGAKPTCEIIDFKLIQRSKTK